MKRLRQPLLLAAAAAALAGTASGCIVEGRGYVRDEPPVAGAPPPPPSSSYGTTDRSTDVEPGPGVDLSEDYFYDRLSPYGYWRWTPEYGRVWVPAGVSADWRPYWDGHWAYTDWGWTFASDVPWGWAAYHYGRWGFGLGLGWYWIPGPIWGPAWVSWRYSAGWVAWAPLGPAGYYWGVGSPAWVAVGERHFTQPIRAVAVTGQRARGIVAATAPQPTVAPRPIAGARAVNGPPVASISRAVGHPIRPVSVSRVLPSTGLGRTVGRVGPGTYGSQRYGTQRYGTATSPRSSTTRDRTYRTGERWGTTTPRSRIDSSVRPGTSRWGAPHGGRWGGGGARYPGSGSISRPQGGGSYSAPRGSAPSGGGHSGGGHSGGGGSSHSGGSHSGSGVHK